MGLPPKLQNRESRSPKSLFVLSFVVANLDNELAPDDTVWNRKEPLGITLPRIAWNSKEYYGIATNSWEQHRQESYGVARNSLK